MAQRYFRAQDTFVAMMTDGSQQFVQKGDVLADSHELVRRDLDGSGLLFRALDTGEDEVPAKSEPAKAEAKAVPVSAGAGPARAAPAKAAGKAP